MSNFLDSGCWEDSDRYAMRAAEDLVNQWTGHIDSLADEPWDFTDPADEPE